jgi:hypothetical protein
MLDKDALLERTSNGLAVFKHCISGQFFDPSSSYTNQHLVFHG